MRDPNRLDNFYEELKTIHRNHFPDLRFGQLITSIFYWITNGGVDPFYVEEPQMIEYIREYVEYTIPRKEAPSGNT